VLVPLIQAVFVTEEMIFVRVNFQLKNIQQKKNLSKSTVFITVPSKLSKEISLFEKREDLKINSHR